MIVQEFKGEKFVDGTIDNFEKVNIARDDK